MCCVALFPYFCTVEPFKLTIMKRLYALMLSFVLTAASAFAMSYDDAARHAYYLTDKMAYELNLSDYQYDRVYQINLDYFLRLRSDRDIDGYLWEYRNACLAKVLRTYQYRLYNRADYFYRPLRILLGGTWYLSAYDRWARDRWFRPAPPPAYRGPVYGRYHGPNHHSHYGHPAPPPARPGNHNGYRDDHRKDYSHGNSYNYGNQNNRPGGHNPGKPDGHGSSKPGGQNHRNPGQQSQYGGGSPSHSGSATPSRGASRVSMGNSGGSRGGRR